SSTGRGRAPERSQPAPLRSQETRQCRPSSVSSGGSKGRRRPALLASNRRRQVFRNVSDSTGSVILRASQRKDGILFTEVQPGATDYCSLTEATFYRCVFPLLFAI